MYGKQPELTLNARAYRRHYMGKKVASYIGPLSSAVPETVVY